MKSMKSAEVLIKRYNDSMELIPEDIRKIVNRQGGLTEQDLLKLILSPQDQSLDAPTPPDDSYIRTQCDVSVCAEIGHSKILNGKVAYCIMAGGAGTRIGEPKALLRLPEVGLSLLTIKLFQSIGIGPIWIIVNPLLKDQVIDHVSAQIGLDHKRIKYVEQFMSYRLHPDNEIVFIDGKPDLYPCGHGDLFPALTYSGVLQEFLDEGGEQVVVVNVDNVLGSLDPMLVGWHALAQSKVTCEVVKKNGADSGGFVCVDRGQVQIAESYRMKGINLTDFQWLNTNSLIFNANLNIKPLGDSWNRVQKNVNGKLMIQHERLLQEITEAYDSMFVAVERDERFFPIKNIDDLNSAAQKFNANKLL